MFKHQTADAAKCEPEQIFKELEERWEDARTRYGVVCSKDIPKALLHRCRRNYALIKIQNGSVTSASLFIEYMGDEYVGLFGNRRGHFLEEIGDPPLAEKLATCLALAKGRGKPTRLNGELTILHRTHLVGECIIVPMCGAPKENTISEFLVVGFWDFVGNC